MADNPSRKTSDNELIRALLAHFFLVTVHPFGDGNGRVSRVVEAAILYEGGYNVHGFYGLSNYFYRNGDEYKRRLQECRRVRPFVREIRRLAELGFIAIDVESGSGAEVVGIDFNAIEMDFEAMRAY